MPRDFEAAANRGQLESVALTRVRFELDPEFDPNTDQASYVLEYDITPSPNPGGFSSVELEVRIVWTNEEGDPWSCEEGDHKPFELALAVTGVFSWVEDAVDSEYLDGWLKFNGTYLLWPYARAHIANVTAASGLPPLTILTLEVPTPSLGQETTEMAALPRDADVG